MFPAANRPHGASIPTRTLFGEEAAAEVEMPGEMIPLPRRLSVKEMKEKQRH